MRRCPMRAPPGCALMGGARARALVRGARAASHGGAGGGYPRPAAAAGKEGLGLAESRCLADPSRRPWPPPPTRAPGAGGRPRPLVPGPPRGHPVSVRATRPRGHPVSDDPSQEAKRPPGLRRSESRGRGATQPPIRVGDSRPSGRRAAKARPGSRPEVGWPNSEASLIPSFSDHLSFNSVHIILIIK